MKEQLSGCALDFYSKGCRFDSYEQRSNLKFPPTEFYHPTALNIEIADRNSAGFMKISKDDFSYWPL